MGTPPRSLLHEQSICCVSVVDGKLYWFVGEQAVGWVAPEDVAAVAAKILTDGHERHGGSQYWLSTDFLNRTQAATEISRGSVFRLKPLSSPQMVSRSEIERK